MKPTTNAALVIALVALCSLPALGQRRRPRVNAPEARQATVKVTKAGDTLSFDGCTDGPRCRSRAVTPSPGDIVHTVVWDVDIQGERVREVEVNFKSGVTPCYAVTGRGRFRNALGIRGRRVQARKGFVRCRIKTRDWSENSDGNLIRSLDRDEYSYTMKVVTDAQTYEVDPIIIVRRGR
jgi:hypothetical protein